MPVDLVKVKDDLGSFRKRFCLSPAQWVACSVTATFAWDRVQFTAANRQRVPEDPGIYAFVIVPSVGALFEHRYLMYIGETGSSPKRNLNVRYGEYLRPAYRAKRIKIDELMKKWMDHIYFYWTTTAGLTDRQRCAVEIGLNDAVIPPCVTKDFSAHIAAAVRAWGGD